MRIDFQGRTVVVTGGSGALGRAVVRRVLDAEGRCVVPVLDSGELDGAPWVGDDSVRVVSGVDLRSADAVASFYDEAAADGLWASVHVAGGFAMSPVVETSCDDFRAQLETNTLTAFGSLRESCRRMTGGGRIVNVAARPALFPELGAGMVAYAASKAAVAAMTQAAGAELASKKILVNAVVPGVMDTPANRAAMPDADVSAWAGVDDVASTIVFLASPQNRSTRSALVPVYGGG